MPLPLLAGAIGKGLLGGAKAVGAGARTVGAATKSGAVKTFSVGKYLAKESIQGATNLAQRGAKVARQGGKQVVKGAKFFKQKVGSVKEKGGNIISKLKENASNIRESLKTGNKNQEKLRTKKQQRKQKEKSIRKKREKEKQLESKKSSSDQNKRLQSIAKSPLDILNKIFSLGGLLLGGILVNAFEGIKKKAEEFYNNNKELFDTIGNFLSGVKDAAVGLFDSFTGPYSEEGAFDDFAKFDDNGKLQSGALKKVEDAYNGFGDLINTIDKALGGKGTAGNFIKTDTTSSTPMPSREELVNQTERRSGMASFREDAAENAALQRSVMGESSGPSKKVSGSLTGTKEEKWAAVMAMAKNAGAKYPELVAAQFALESAWGTALAAKNNFFGIKATGKEDATVSTTEVVYGGKRVTIDARFKNFATPQDAINHLVNQWYKDYRGYSGVNNAPNAAAAALKLKSEGYATDPVYAQSLQRLMREYSNIQPKQSQPKITPVPDKGNQARVINQPDPTDEEVATLFIQRVNTIQYVPVPVTV